MEKGNSYAGFRMVNLHATKRIKSAKIFTRKHLEKLSPDLVAIRLGVACQNTVVDIDSHNCKSPIVIPNGENALVSEELFETVIS